MADISKIKLSDNTEYNLKDTQARNLLSSNNESDGDISVIQLSDNTQYNVKDAQAREDIETITTDVKAQVNADKDLINNEVDFIDDETLDEYSEKIEEMQDAYKKFIPINTTSGTEITIDNSNNDKAITNIGLDGNTVQASNPTPDYPQEVKVVTGENTINVVGKNKLPNNLTTTTLNSVTFTVNTDKSISLSGTASATTDVYFEGDSSNYVDLGLKTGTYNLNGAENGSGSTYMLYMVQNRNGSLSYHTSYGSLGASISVQEGDTFRIFIRVISGASTGSTIYPQLEQGSTATTYEAYQSQSYPIHLQGKNLFNIQALVKGRLDSGVLGYGSNTTDLTLNADSFSFTTNTYWRGVTTEYIMVEPSSDYTFKSDFELVDAGIDVACYDNQYNFIQNLTQTTINNYTKKVTTTNSAKYVRIDLQVRNAGTTTMSNPQFEKSSTATTYERYWKIELAKTGTYKDKMYKDSGKWYLHKEIGKVVLNGTEADWQKHTSSSTDDNRFWIYNQLSGIITANESTLMEKVLTNYFTQALFSNTAYGKFSVNATSGNQWFLLNVGNIASDVNGLKTWLNSHYTNVYYPLAIPTITEITDTNLISQLEAVKLLSGTQNNFTIDADTLPTLNLNYIGEANPHL